MNKPKKQSLTMKKKKNLNNLIIEKPNNISITKPKKRCKTVNTNTTRSIPKENNQRDEKILDLASCRYKHISDKYLRELMIKGQDNKNNQSRNKEVMKQTIQSGSTIGVNGGNTRNSTITNPSLNVKHKTEKPFKEIEDLVDTALDTFKTASERSVLKTLIFINIHLVERFYPKKAYASICVGFLLPSLVCTRCTTERAI